MGTGGAVISSPLSKVHPIENALYQYKYIRPNSGLLKYHNFLTDGIL